METQKAVKQTQVKKLENSAVQLTVTVDGAQTRSYYNDTLGQYAKSVQIKGFRKGHVPASVLEHKFGASIQSESFYRLLENAVHEALETVAEKPYHASTPTLLNEADLKPELDKDFSFTVQYDIFPEFTLPNYEGIEVEVPQVSVTPKDVEAELKKIQEQNAMMIEKPDAAAETGHSVTVAYQRTDAEAAGTKAAEKQKTAFTVGAGHAPYRMDEAVIGMKKDETKTLTQTFPADDTDADLAGKTITLQITVLSVKVKEIPALDDELAQDVNEAFKTLADLKADTEKKLNEQLENRLRSQKSDRIFDRLIEASPIPLPESMVQAELQQNLNQFSAQMGMKPEQLAQMLKKEGSGEDPIQALTAEWRPNTERNLRQSLILNKIVEEKAIQISDDELEAEYQRIASENNRPLNEIKDYYLSNHAESYLKAEMQTKKALDLLIEKAAVKTGKKMPFLEFMKN